MATILLVLLIAPFAAAGSNKPLVRNGKGAVRPQDQVLLLNSRPAGCSTNVERLADDLTAFRRCANGWSAITWQEVAAWNEPGVATVFYVHGNDINASDAKGRGIDVYRRLIRCGADDRPIRFIIWSWPANVVEGRLRDFQVKAQRTRPVGFQLAWFVQQMPPDMSLGFLGYSYGARVESIAAHLLAGGCVGGLRLAEPAPLHRPTQHVYMAPAFDADWLSPRGYNGRTMLTVDNLLTTTNRRDPAMRFFPLISRDVTERALGFDGPNGLPRRYASRVRLVNATQSVGRSHDLYDYLKVPGLMSNAWRRLTFANRNATPTPTVAVASNEQRPTAGH